MSQSVLSFRYDDRNPFLFLTSLRGGAKIGRLRVELRVPLADLRVTNFADPRNVFRTAAYCYRHTLLHLLRVLAIVVVYVQFELSPNFAIVPGCWGICV